MPQERSTRADAARSLVEAMREVDSAQDSLRFATDRKRNADHNLERARKACAMHPGIYVYDGTVVSVKADGTVDVERAVVCAAP
jgi:hypothetical protein